MNNQALLNALESSHAVVAQSIIALRDVIKNEASFTAAAKTAAQMQIKQHIGAAQVRMDALPDYRSSAVSDEA